MSMISAERGLFALGTSVSAVKNERLSSIPCRKEVAAVASKVLQITTHIPAM